MAKRVLFALPFVAVGAGFSWFLWTKVINDVNVEISFETLALAGLPEMAATASADLNLSTDLVQRITRLQIGEWSHEPLPENRMSGMAFSRPSSGSSCTALSLVPGRKSEKDTCNPPRGVQLPMLTIAPQGPPGCAVVIETEGTMAGVLKIPTLKQGEQVVITLEPNASNPPGFPEVVFERASVGGLTGRLAEPIVLFGEFPQQRCGGAHLGTLAADKIEVQAVRLDVSRPKPVLEAVLHIKALNDIRVDGRDCRRVVFWQLARYSLLGHILTALLSGAIGYFVGLRFLRRRGEKKAAS